MIRSSANWDASDVKSKKTKSKKKNNGCSGYSGGGSVKILSEAERSGCGPVPDVWCGPGVGFSTDAVVSGTVEAEPPRRNIPARRKIDGEVPSVITKLSVFLLHKSCLKTQTVTLFAGLFCSSPAIS